MVVEDRAVLQGIDLSETSYHYVSDGLELPLVGAALTFGLDDHCGGQGQQGRESDR